jgi:predicted DNA repair protein MutK
LMKALGVAGTIAMFLVGGGILSHGISMLHQFSSHFLFEGFVGIMAGALAVGCFELYKKIILLSKLRKN